MRFVLYLVALLAVLAAAAAIYVRVAPIDPDRWHVDPAEVSPPATPNFALLAGRQAVPVDADPAIVAERLGAVAEAEGARVLAGSLDEGFASFVVRSGVIGFPDVVSIRLTARDGGTDLHIFSRSRFGLSDLGVNTARVQRWITAARGD